MTTFSNLLAIISAFILVVLLAIGLVIYGLRGAFYSGQDVGSRLENYVTMRDESIQPQNGQKRRSGLIRWR